MRIDILTGLPELFTGPFQYSILGRAIERRLLEIHLHNLHDYAENKHKKIDDRPYGGRAGMVLTAPPIIRCINHLQQEVEYQALIYMAPDGTPLTQKLVNHLSLQKNLLLLCGHYKGIDERIRKHWMTHAISIGDYVLSGGELPAAVLVDAIARLLPGALSDETSALSDSFQDGLVAPPVYTRPYAIDGKKVPDILLSGNEKAIQAWEYEAALENTKKRRPQLFDRIKHAIGAQEI